jgi:hypothetical protein
MWTVDWHPDAREEFRKLPPDERVAIQHAVQKLELLGPQLPAPHQSAVRGRQGQGLRELRPRGGRSPWRALYDRSQDTFRIAGIAPDAEVNQRRFNRAVGTARQRLEEWPS